MWRKTLVCVGKTDKINRNQLNPSGWLGKGGVNYLYRIYQRKCEKPLPSGGEEVNAVTIEPIYRDDRYNQLHYPRKRVL